MNHANARFDDASIHLTTIEVATRGPGRPHEPRRHAVAVLVAAFVAVFVAPDRGRRRH